MGGHVQRAHLSQPSSPSLRMCSNLLHVLASSFSSTSSHSTQHIVQILCSVLRAHDASIKVQVATAAHHAPNTQDAAECTSSQAHPGLMHNNIWKWCQKTSKAHEAHEILHNLVLGWCQAAGYSLANASGHGEAGRQGGCSNRVHALSALIDCISSCLRCRTGQFY